MTTTIALIPTSLGKHEVSLFPWEDPAVYVAEVEAMLADNKPFFDLDADEFDALTLNDPHLNEGAPTCAWSFAGDGEPADSRRDEPGYYESLQPYLF